MGTRWIGSLLPTCFICTAIALANEDNPATLDGDPTTIGLMTPAAKTELISCVTDAAESAGDGQERKTMVGVFIGSKGRSASLAVLESSGLERLDKLVLRCLFRANYTPATPGKPPIQWIFKARLPPKRHISGSKDA